MLHDLVFHLLKFFIWLAGIVVVLYFALPFFGYEINLNYFKESKTACQERFNQCTKNLIENGTKNVKCDVMCVDPKLIIKKQ